MQPQELITMLKAQHRTLIADLAAALESSIAGTDPGNQETVASLARFDANLKNHLRAESELLYPDYLRKLADRNEDAANTQAFIQEMDDLAQVILAFLKKYAAPEEVAAAASGFRKELLEIIATLNLRIETEEEGLFDIYLAM